MIILLVEDNEGDIALTQIAFGDSGIDGELVVARDGAEAVDRLYGRGEFADAELPDLMLVDLNMPRMDGKELLDVVKGDEDLKTIPVIMLSSKDGVFDRTSALVLADEATFDFWWARGVLSLYAQLPGGDERAATRRDDWRAWVRAIPEA